MPKLWVNVLHLLCDICSMVRNFAFNALYVHSVMLSIFCILNQENFSNLEDVDAFDLPDL